MTLLNWQRSIEQIAVANKNCRLLGFASVRPGAGVSLICRRVAKTMAVNGMKTLLVSFSEPPTNASAANHDKQDKLSAATILRANVVPSRHGYDLLPLCGSEGLNVVLLRNTFESDFADYGRIIFDLPPISHVAADGLSTVAVSVICDRVILVCLVGTDRRGEIAEAVSLLRAAGATVSGLVANEYQVVSPWPRFFRSKQKRPLANKEARLQT